MAKMNTSTIRSLDKAATGVINNLVVFIRFAGEAEINDNISIKIPDSTEIDIIPEDIKLDILYEDEDLIVVNKPVGMITHPAPGVTNGTLVNALLFHFAG
jgi:23S rRNA pseudouridine1911/1915/1917 synthase